MNRLLAAQIIFFVFFFFIAFHQPLKAEDLNQATSLGAAQSQDIQKIESSSEQNEKEFESDEEEDESDFGHQSELSSNDEQQNVKIENLGDELAGDHIDERIFESVYFRYWDQLQASPAGFAKRLKDYLKNEKFARVLVDALWDADARWRQKRTSGRKASKTTPVLPALKRLFGDSLESWQSFPVTERFRLSLLAIRYNVTEEIDLNLKNEMIDAFQTLFGENGEDGQYSDIKSRDDFHLLRGAYLILAEKELLKKAQAYDVLSFIEHNKHPAIIFFQEAVYPQLTAKQEQSTQNTDLESSVDELLQEKDDDEQSSLFIFCRKNREFPCLMLLKKADGQFLKKDDEIWNSEALASSNKGWDFYKRLGHTPAGIYSMKGVMPVANRTQLFGKFRRIILDYYQGPKATSQDLEQIIESNIKLLPENERQKQWWKQAIIAKVIGRNLLRIHGTGKRARFKGSSYYPFVKTNGCISQREGKYNGKGLKDQRELLDALMEAQGLSVNNNNETKIQGKLFLVELDDQERAVELSDLHLGHDLHNEQSEQNK